VEANLRYTEEPILPSQDLPSAFDEAVQYEFGKEFDRLNRKAMNALSFWGEYSTPMRQWDLHAPDELYPERYEDFEDWVMDNMLDSLLHALEQQPFVKEMEDAVVSLANPGVTSANRPPDKANFSALERADEKLARDQAQTLEVVRAEGVADRVFGPNHNLVSRVRWLDIDDGIQDIVRWETRIRDIELFGSKRLKIDEIRADVTYDEAQIRISKARPFNIPVLALAKIEANDDGLEWGLGFTAEQRHSSETLAKYQDARLGFRPRPPVTWRLDCGIFGRDGETGVGLVVRGFI